MCLQTPRDRLPRRLHEGRGQQVLEFRNHQHVAGQHRAGDRCQGRNHDREHLRVAEVLQVRPNHERRLGLPDEDIGRRVHRFDGTRPDHFVQEATDEPDDPLHDAQVVQHRHQGGKEDDDRQHVDGETETDDVRIGQRPEHHVDAGVRKPDDSQHAFAQGVDEGPAAIPEQNDRRDSDLQRECGADDAQVDGLAITRECDRGRENRDDAENADVVAHVPTPDYCASSRAQRSDLGTASLLRCSQ